MVTLAIPRTGGLAVGQHFNRYFALQRGVIGGIYDARPAGAQFFKYAVPADVDGMLRLDTQVLLGRSAFQEIAGSSRRANQPLHFLPDGGGGSMLLQPGVKIQRLVGFPLKNQIFDDFPLRSARFGFRGI
jgi:hypothetical protein